MAETTHPPNASNTPDFRTWCAWHQGYSDTTRAVRAIEQASGPGYVLYACKGCRTINHLTLLAEQP
ncbi:hypothetical protein OK074_7635 [Actinobacteria bacterium OK074]|nr:hypothetical protein OK074_7635 [Actinobacteria bacterium OK074]